MARIVRFAPSWIAACADKSCKSAGKFAFTRISTRTILSWAGGSCREPTERLKNVVAPEDRRDNES